MSEREMTGGLRIGELARRTGVTPELLRAWEQRYGLLKPARSAGGFRLYSEQDERRVRRTTALIAEGLSAAEAASQALADDPSLGSSDLPIVSTLASELRGALDGFDSEGAHRAFDQLVATISVEAVLEDVVVPYLHELGLRWERGDVSIAQEHFASNLIRGRLMGLSRDWTAVAGPTVVLACPPGEEHDLGLIMFGIALARRGRRVVFLGADTPVETTSQAVAATRPSATVLAVTRPESLRASHEALRALAGQTPLMICGQGADPDEVLAIGAQLLSGDPVSAARQLAG